VSETTPAGQPQQVPTCYRHPDRETYISCTRCGRPICPDCMRDAAVGFQCPECVADGARATREPRTVGGGRLHRDPTLVTKVLVVLNVVLFGVQQIWPVVTTKGALIGYPLAVGGEWYRLVSSAFLHVSITHLLFNMLALWFVGGAIEPRLGRTRYLTVYLVSALAGSVLSYAVDPVNAISVGASGAVFGLFGALAILALRLRFDVRGVIAIIAINVVIGFVPGLNINWRAHLGGLLAGTVLTAAMVYAPRAHRVLAGVVASLLVVGACAWVTVWRTDVIRQCASGERSATQCESLVSASEGPGPAVARDAAVGQRRGVVRGA
jgi:membrane associated rhomboid family serine protease